MSASLPAVIDDWFAQRGWRLRDHQAGMLKAARDERHALLVAATGAGKTLAGFLPSLVDLIETPSEGLHTLYISPLKALAVDVQRNLLTPIEEMGLPIRVETRSGDTPSNRKQRQRSRPPQMLLTTPESLSLLLSYPDADRLFGGLRTIIVDEVHAFAKEKRGDLLSLAMARLQKLSPGMRRVGLSATIADPDAYRAWLAPDGDIDAVRLVEGEPGAPADLSILTPEERVPWSGHSGRYAASQVLDLIDQHGASIIFCNTRSLCELIFQDLWSANDKQLPIGVHHGSLSREARRKVELAMAEGRLRGLVATASLDMGLDWGNVDLVAQMGAPKGSSRLLQRVGRANHRLNEPSKGMIVPGNRFEYLEARACLDAIDDGELDPEQFRPGALDVLAQHVMGVACAGPFRSDELLAEVRSAAPYAGLRDEEWEAILQLNATGGYALKAYDKYRRLVEQEPGLWRITKPAVAQKHRLNAGVIVDNVMMDVRFRNGRKIGRVEEGFGSTLTIGDAFFFSGLSLEVEGFKDADIIVRASKKDGRIVSYGGQRMSMSTHLAARVRGFLADRTQWTRFPDDVREWLDVQSRRSILPEPHELLVETFPHEGRHYLVAYSFDGWNAHQSLGMLITNRMERAGLKPLNWVANDYALAVSSLAPVTDPRALFSADILEDEFRQWVEESHLLKRAFREVAVIGGLVERQHPGQRKTGKQVSFSTDLIYDVLKRYEPDHLLMRAAWEDAKARMTELGRLARLVERAAATMVHVEAERVTPLAVPLMVVIGREQAPGGAADEALLVEAEQALIDAAMRID
ncbi:ligase-associated DNA damage response DEXH box helicase [Sphingomicrobium astaxanthinifaciens]|uniref:ligase-associated DNA damage response DEXH box helicase n=1 Tax=Sphingomicrobium astaxanthinifaciens TaxID=1227949 RepID=UPI001FCBE4B4|nr:ligase-associated DNA damage response DEXH box helicase [Sphingomicrobium astaxanthinifaciens]MCJ7420906.1 ligase-associated DNA damage response DEXH box helicase [Sphingomicrobium astaxanthinifaciens]